jgi:hypothetical protein
MRTGSSGRFGNTGPSRDRARGTRIERDATQRQSTSRPWSAVSRATFRSPRQPRSLGALTGSDATQRSSAMTASRDNPRSLLLGQVSAKPGESRRASCRLYGAR